MEPLEVVPYDTPRWLHEVSSLYLPETPRGTAQEEEEEEEEEPNKYTNMIIHNTRPGTSDFKAYSTVEKMDSPPFFFIFFLGGQSPRALV